MHGETLQTLTPAAGWQIGDLILLWQEMSVKETKSCVTCLGPRSTSWCPSRSQDKFFQDPFQQP